MGLFPLNTLGFGLLCIFWKSKDLNWFLLKSIPWDTSGACHVIMKTECTDSSIAYWYIGKPSY